MNRSFFYIFLLEAKLTKITIFGTTLRYQSCYHMASLLLLAAARHRHRQTDKGVVQAALTGTAKSQSSSGDRWVRIDFGIEVLGALFQGESAQRNRLSRTTSQCRVPVDIETRYGTKATATYPSGSGWVHIIPDQEDAWKGRLILPGNAGIFRWTECRLLAETELW